MKKENWRQQENPKIITVRENNDAYPKQNDGKAYLLGFIHENVDRYKNWVSLGNIRQTFWYLYSFKSNCNVLSNKDISWETILDFWLSLLMRKKTCSVRAWNPWNSQITHTDFRQKHISFKVYIGINFTEKL